MHTYINKKCKAYSMAEFAIYLTIISILAYFTILKSKAVLYQYRQKALVSQLGSYEAAVQVFIDKYNCLPGHINNIEQAFKKEKNKIIKGNNENVFKNDDEARCFWSQLAASELIGINLEKGMPSSPFGGRINIRKENDTGELWFVVESDDGSGILEESEINNIIACYDDGNTDSGNIKSKEAGKKYSLLYRFL